MYVETHSSICPVSSLLWSTAWSGARARKAEPDGLMLDPAQTWALTFYPKKSVSSEVQMQT